MPTEPPAPTPTPTVPAPKPPAAKPTSFSGTNCAGTAGSSNPSYASMDACGYPSPDTTGVPAGTHLTASGSITVSTSGAVVNALDVTGVITVAASNVTIENTEVSTAGSFGIFVNSGVTGTVIKDVTIHGTGTTAAGDLQWGIAKGSMNIAAVTADHVDFYDGERILNGPGTLTNSFCLDTVDNPGAHYECVYEGGGSVTINHDTLLVAHTQTAAIFISTDFAALGTVQITNNLLAGGGYTIYGYATNEHAYGIGAEMVTGNRFSRLYYPDDGYWGPTSYMPTSYTWSGNVWDNTGQSVSP
jgi:hypothetical protein